MLKPEGLFVNADKYAHPNSAQHKTDLRWQLNQFKDKYASIGRSDLVREWTAHYLEDNSPNVLMVESDSIEEMWQIGFIGVEKVYREHMEAVVVARKFTKRKSAPAGI